MHVYVYDTNHLVLYNLKLLSKLLIFYYILYKCSELYSQMLSSWILDYSYGTIFKTNTICMF